MKTIIASAIFWGIVGLIFGWPNPEAWLQIVGGTAIAMVGLTIINGSSVPKL